MAVMLTKRTVVLAKIESTYGTDPTPDAANNAIEAYDPSITINADMKERYPGSDDISRFPELRGKTSVEVKFSTKIRGSGTEGTAPRQSPLFTACGTSETIVSATSVTYAPESSGFDSVTLYVYIDGIQHIVSGCVGDMEIDLTAGEMGVINWTFKGIYQIGTDQAIVTPTFDTTTPEIVKGTTTTFGSYSAVIEKCTLKLGNVIAERPDFNQAEGIKGFAITGRNPEGSLTVEAVLRATSNADFLNYFDGGTSKALSLVLGATAGNICTLTAGQCVLRAPVYGDREGVRTFELPIQLAKSSGNDEISIAFS